MKDFLLTLLTAFATSLFLCLGVAALCGVLVQEADWVHRVVGLVGYAWAGALVTLGVRLLVPDGVK